MSFDDTQLVPCESTKNLGVVLDSSLGFRSYIDSIVKTCNFHIRNLYMIKDFVNRKNLVTLVLSDESLYSNLSTVIRNKFCIVAGDFNCSVNWKTQTADAESMRLLDFANEEYLTQWVDKPTRGNNTLDLVFSSEDNMISKLSVGEKLGKSDHNMIRFEI